VVDAVGGFRGRGHGYLDWIGEQAARERGDLGWHRRREEQVLPALRKHAGDPPDGLDKTKVEHAIGLVEDKDFGLAKARRAAIEMILETARGRDQNVEAARERLDLGAMRHAAENDRGGERQTRAKASKTLGDLARQFARRTEHQHAAAIARGGAPVCRKIIKNGKREGRRLASAGLGYANEVAASHDRGNGLRLDGGWLRVTLFCQGMEKRRGEAEPGKISQFQSFLKAGARALKTGACTQMAEAGAGFPARRPKCWEATPRVPGLSREATIARPEGGQKSITRPERQIHDEADGFTWRFWRRKSNEKLSGSIGHAPGWLLDDGASFMSGNTARSDKNVSRETILSGFPARPDIHGLLVGRQIKISHSKSAKK
jgi:hypothetical protein